MIGSFTAPPKLRTLEDGKDPPIMHQTKANPLLPSRFLLLCCAHPYNLCFVLALAVCLPETSPLRLDFGPGWWSTRERLTIPLGCVCILRLHPTFPGPMHLPQLGFFPCLSFRALSPILPHSRTGGCKSCTDPYTMQATSLLRSG